MTTGEWFDRYLVSMAHERSPMTMQRYEQIIRLILAPRLGALPIAKLSSVHIEDMYAALASGGRHDNRPGGLAAVTRRQVHFLLSAMMQRAVEHKLVARNPCDLFRKRLPKVERRPMTALTVDQSQRLLAATRHSHIYWPVLLALSTGMRRGEVLALRWGNVDLDRGTLRVVESLEQTNKAPMRFKPPKTGKT
jgi:integrase